VIWHSRRYWNGSR